VDREQIKEQIRYETEVFKLAWATAGLTIGGLAGLVLGEVTGVRAGLLGLGLLTTLTLVIVAIRQDRTIRQFVRDMEGT